MPKMMYVYCRTYVPEDEPAYAIVELKNADTGERSFLRYDDIWNFDDEIISNWWWNRGKGRDLEEFDYKPLTKCVF